LGSSVRAVGGSEQARRPLSNLGRSDEPCFFPECNLTNGETGAFGEMGSFSCRFEVSFISPGDCCLASRRLLFPFPPRQKVKVEAGWGATGVCLLKKISSRSGLLIVSLIADLLASFTLPLASSERLLLKCPAEEPEFYLFRTT